MKYDDSEPLVTPATTVETAVAGRLLKRSEAAKLLGMSVSSLRRREGDLVRPIVGPDGVHLFDEAEIRSVSVVVRRGQAVATLGASAGDVAAEVFTLLDEGEHPVEIVKRLHLAPDVVVALQAQWAEMRSGFILSAEQAGELALAVRSQVPHSGARAVADVRTFVDRLHRSRSGSARCQLCGGNAACVCEPCAVDARGPLATWQVALERRTVEGTEEVRVAARVGWVDSFNLDGAKFPTLRSEWVARDRAKEAELDELVEALEERDAVARG